MIFVLLTSEFHSVMVAADERTLDLHVLDQFFLVCE